MQYSEIFMMTVKYIQEMGCSFYLMASLSKIRKGRKPLLFFTLTLWSVVMFSMNYLMVRYGESLTEGPVNYIRVIAILVMLTGLGLAMEDGIFRAVMVILVSDIIMSVLTVAADFIIALLTGTTASAVPSSPEATFFPWVIVTNLILFFLLCRCC